MEIIAILSLIDGIHTQIQNRIISAWMHDNPCIFTSLSSSGFNHTIWDVLRLSMR